jgi:hypothetical protein
MSELTPRDRERIAEIDTLTNRVRHAYAMVEQFAGSPAEAERRAVTLRRTFNQLKLQFTGAGLDRIAQMFGGLEMTARRGISHGPKSRSLREGVGNIMRALEVERRTIITAAQREVREAGEREARE